MVTFAELQEIGNVLVYEGHAQLIKESQFTLVEKQAQEMRTLPDATQTSDVATNLFKVTQPLGRGKPAFDLDDVRNIAVEGATFGMHLSLG